MAPSADFDLVVIGSGPGGYTAAIRAAQLGMKVACVEKEPKLGGTCLRVGCIPSKTLLETTEKFVTARDRFSRIGIKCDNVQMDLPVLMARKDKVVDTLATGIAGLFKKNKVERIIGTAEFTGPKKIKVTAAAGDKTITAGKFLIATGSVPIELPNLKFDGKKIISSDQAIALDRIPEKMVVIGAGAIGLELSSVWSRLGVKVTVLEIYHTTLPGADEEMSKLMEKTLREQGMTFHFASQATSIKEDKTGLKVRFAPKDAKPGAGTETELPADVVLVAVGRKAYTGGLNLAAAGVQTDQRGRITINHAFQTSSPDIFAIGDVVAGPMLAHKAEEEGVAAVELMAGKAGHVDYNTIPLVVYTAPELAWVGKTQEELTTQGVKFRVGKFRFTANARAMCMDEAHGLVKILADEYSDRVLGVHILGPQASSLIAEAVMAMAMGASSEDIARTCHAHPSLPEALREAALGVEGRMINS
jgi:dihydrolipoamide dehydrogenase